MFLGAAGVEGKTASCLSLRGGAGGGVLEAPEMRRRVLEKRWHSKALMLIDDVDQNCPSKAPHL